MKEVKVAIGDKILVDIDDMLDFQGDLKELTVENYERGKASILENDFSFVPHVWTAKGKHHLLDGHQRKRILSKMREEGYKIPKIPAIQVKAPNLKAAKKKVLAAASQYGNVTSEGLYQFITEADISHKEIDVQYTFPEIDMGEFQQSYFTEPKTVEFQAGTGGREIGEGDINLKHECPRCKFRFSDDKP